jgi:hypothetical protein
MPYSKHSFTALATKHFLVWHSKQLVVIDNILLALLMDTESNIRVQTLCLTCKIKVRSSTSRCWSFTWNSVALLSIHISASGSSTMCRHGASANRTSLWTGRDTGSANRGMSWCVLLSCDRTLWLMLHWSNLNCIHFNFFIFKRQSRDSSVGIALGYGLDDRGSRARFPAGAENFSLHHRVQSGSGAHPASYPVDTRGSFLGGKAPGAWSWPLCSI